MTASDGSRRVRLDVLLVERGLVETRARARALIMAGRVRSGEQRLDKPGARLELEAELRRADVLFLVDTTQSMEEEINQIRVGLRDVIAPGIDQAVPDSALGVASFGDFPEGSCGSFESGDVPFRLVLPVTTELNSDQAAMDSLELGGLIRAADGAA